MKRWKPLIAAITVAILGSMMLFAFQQDEGQLEVIWGKQWGTAADELVSDIALDRQGNIYISGGTKGNLFGQNQGDWDIYVIKLDSKGQILWGKQLGSEGKEIACKIAIGEEGNLYLFTTTEEDWFGKNLGRKDTVLIKLSPDGQLLGGKRIGTNKDELATDIAVDHQGYVYIIGDTRGSLVAQYQGGFYDGFLAKLDHEGKVIWGKQFPDELTAISVDNQSNVYVTGETINKTINSHVTFLAKFSSDGRLIWRQVLPPVTAGERIDSISVDGKGNIYGVGYFKLLAW